MSRWSARDTSAPTTSAPCKHFPTSASSGSPTPPSTGRARWPTLRDPGVFASLSDMAKAHPDVVHVLTPPASHARLAIEGARNGLRRLRRKADGANGRRVRRDDRRSDPSRTLSVNHSAKDDPVVVRALELLRRGACGDVLAVDFYRTSDYPPYAGGHPSGFPIRRLSVPGHGHPCALLMEAFSGQSTMSTCATGRPTRT